jgi:RND family efflux transporter MFP subunit
MLRPLYIALALVASLSACGKPPGKGDSKDAATPPPKLVIGAEDVMMVESGALASGPVVTGSIQPERRADLRAEISAVVLQVLKENGDVVRQGDVLVRLDPTAIRDNLQSAEASVRNATLALDQAERNLTRLKTLRESGMTSLQALDDAEVRRNAAQSELSAANARAVQARQQMERTVVRAPFNGVVSDRKVSAGDTAAVGKELLKVIDPTSMRFAGRISADKVSLVKIGQPVSFRINGYPNQEFRGKVTRMDPSANDVTRQVEVLVDFADANQPRVAGLFAEGNITAEKVMAITLPESVLVKAGDKVSAWRVKDKKLSKVDLALGVRDNRTGFYEIRSGLAQGDVVLRNPGSNLKEGQEAELVSNKPAVASSNAAQGT